MRRKGLSGREWGGLNRPGKGFTLIELLTVMLVITILAGLMTTGFMKVRERARRAYCSENLRQIGMACQLYSQNFGDFFPTVAGGGAPSRPLVSLSLIFEEEYLKNRDVFRCPSTSDQCFDLSPGDTFGPHGQIQPGADAKRRECSFGYDDLKGRLTQPDVPIAADALPAPGEETVSVSVGIGGQGQKAGKNSANHGGEGQSILFYDGHTKWAGSCFCGVDEDNIYEAADPNNVATTDSYIHQQ